MKENNTKTSSKKTLETQQHSGVVVNEKATIKFIAKFKDKHGDTYDYKDVVMTKPISVVKIICKKHGPFTQSPYVHAGGGGCMKCGRERTLSARTGTTEEFIKKSKKRFGDKFTYTNTVYVKKNERLKLECDIHGEVEISPETHLIAVTGCPKCRYVSSFDKLTHTRNDFIAKSKARYGDDLIYDKVVYVNNKVNVIT